MDNPSFFKVMIGDDFRTTLRIPPYFKKNIGDEIHKSSLLRGYGGRQWKVKMGVVDEDIYFQNGWEKIILDNSISLGDFLVFFYDGNGGFDLKIYGPTCCEKDELFGFIEVKAEQESDESDKKMITATENLLNPHDRVYKRKRKFGDLARNVLAEGNSGQKNSNRIITGLRTLENAKALKAACDFSTSNHHFIAPCRKSRAAYMTIPRELVKEFNLDEKRKIVLRDPCGTSWTVRLSIWQDGRVSLAEGWAKMYKENDFKDGDVCILEFVQGGNAIDVHVFRATERWAKPHRKSSERSLNMEERARLQSIANSFDSVHPNFITLFRPTRLYHMPIPKKIAIDLDLLKNQGTTLVDPLGNQWPVKITVRTHGLVEFGVGFGLFSKENSLSTGDVCIFEFVEGAKRIQVHIYRPGECSNSSEKDIDSISVEDEVPDIPLLCDSSAPDAH